MTPPPMNDAAERTLPHNLDAERAVLGGILMSNSAYLDAARSVTAADFFRQAHRDIFDALASLIDRQDGAADYVLLVNDLKRRGTLERAGGPLYVSGLVDGVPRTGNVRHYAEVVKEASRARALITTLATALNDCYEHEVDVDAVLSHADGALLALRRGSDHTAAKDLAARTSGLLSDLEYRFANRGKLFGIDTGFPCLNEMTLGLQRGALVVVGARPSMGKTALTTNMLTAAAAYPLPEGQSGKRVSLMFSMEMQARQIEVRLLSSLSRIPSQRILSGALGGGDWAALTQAMEAMHELGIVIDDTPTLTVADVRARCREVLSERGRLDEVVIDYVQLMTGSLNRKSATRTEELGDISRRLKALARELDVPMMVLSQLKRLAGARPTPEDLRECGNLEQDADIILFLHRKKHTDDGPTELIVAKHRNGPTGTRMLYFEPQIVRFEDRGQEPPTPEVTKAEEAQAETTRRKRSYARRHQGRGVIDE